MALTAYGKRLVRAWLGDGEAALRPVWVLELQPILAASPFTASTKYFGTATYEKVGSGAECPGILIPPTISLTIYDEAVLRDLTVRDFVTGEPFRSSPFQLGDVLLRNESGAFDELFTTYDWAGATGSLKIGDLRDAYASFEIFMPVRVDLGMSYSWFAGERYLRLPLKPGLFDPELPLLPNTFAGSGGDEGDAELKGEVKPLALGVCRQVRPSRVSRYRYIVSDPALGGITDIPDVQDGGFSVAYTKDLANNAFTLTTDPGQEITCDVHGVAFGTGSAWKRAGSLMGWILENRGSVASGDIVGVSAYDTAWPYDAGWYFSDASTTILEGLERLARPIGVWVPSPDGKIELKTMTLAGSSGSDFDRNVVNGIEFTPRERVASYYAWGIGHRHHVLSQFYSTLPSADAVRVSTPWTWIESTTSPGWRDPGKLRSETPFDDGNGSQVTAMTTKLGTVHAELYSIRSRLANLREVRDFIGDEWIGDLVRINETSLYAGSPTNQVVVTIELNLAENEVNLQTWGSA